MTEERSTTEQRGKPYDVWAISCASTSFICRLLAMGLAQGLKAENLLKYGPPMGSAQTASQLISLLALVTMVTAVIALVTGVAGLFLFRKSRWLAALALLLLILGALLNFVKS